ncbi:hypothetical protein C4D60_Mb04t15890 [Musa balbisiana]|uniref:Bystin n=1 Tax=Musa balbisiana TaxID=52838 RepID=A0A4S8KCD1_MUSBA|nr:hypothetical protein C4D60_Mb04t15890 [Musa balbisiana]
MPGKESKENSAPPPPQHRVALHDDDTIVSKKRALDFIPTLRDPEGSSQPAEGNPPGSGGRELHPLSAVAVDPSVALNNDAEDVDEFDGFSETQSRYDGGEVEIDEEDEKVMAAFMSTKSGRSSHWRTSSSRGSKRRKRSSLLVSLVSFVTYNNLSLNWIVASLICIRGYTVSASCSVGRISERIRVHFALYQALKKSVYKPAAFFTGVLLPLCQSGTCTLQEAVIIGSIIQKVSIPPLHSIAALMKLAELEYCGTTSSFINPFLGKKYALPYRVLDVVVAHFMRFLEDTRIMPVIWHQLVLAFVQRYAFMSKVDNQQHLLISPIVIFTWVTPEICRELKNSWNWNHGEEEDPMATYILGSVVLIKSTLPLPFSVINKPIEDRWDFPEVPMVED